MHQQRFHTPRSMAVHGGLIFACPSIKMKEFEKKGE